MMMTNFMFFIYVFQIVGMLMTYFVVSIKCISDSAGDIMMTYLVILTKILSDSWHADDLLCDLHLMYFR